MRTDESVFGVSGGIKFLGEIAETYAKFEIQLVPFAFEAVETHVRDERESSAKLRMLAYSGVKETHADSGVV